MTSPALILLDEPLSGLDSEMSVAVVSSLARLAGRGATVLMSLHQASGYGRVAPSCCAWHCVPSARRFGGLMSPASSLLLPLRLHRALAAHVAGLVLLAGGCLVYCGPYANGPAFIQSLGHKCAAGLCSGKGQDCPLTRLFDTCSDMTSALLAAPSAPSCPTGCCPTCRPLSSCCAC